MVGWLVNNNLEKMVNSEILFWHSPEDTEENQWTSQSWQPTKIWSWNLIWSMSATYSTMTFGYVEWPSWIPGQELHALIYGPEAILKWNLNYGVQTHSQSL